MASLRDSSDKPTAPNRDPSFERKALLGFGVLCGLLAAAFLVFPSLWEALANPYESMAKAMATIAELCRW